MTEQTHQTTQIDDELLSITEAAELLRAPVATLRYWRHLDQGPRSFRVGRSVRYWRSEVVAWLYDQANGVHSGGPRLDGRH